MRTCDAPIGLTERSSVGALASEIIFFIQNMQYRGHVVMFQTDPAMMNFKPCQN